eukprot:CAMPEP_0174936680 /NCGR_PEP_ID=MMETSP1355-20121228/58267_1 /TAXON_ID=464990 /ORGANISM="Hemiselmis tepida, Strain CCMP443" /LENGTH=52 /DNA_ID=CAMNT_0016183479 /DNA_START=280 /DNA_END=435 /DNA_ORIENTATION=-
MPTAAEPHVGFPTLPSPICPLPLDAVMVKPPDPRSVRSFVPKSNGTLGVFHA